MAPLHDIDPYANPLNFHITLPQGRRGRVAMFHVKHSPQASPSTRRRHALWDPAFTPGTSEKRRRACPLEAGEHP